MSRARSPDDITRRISRSPTTTRRHKRNRSRSPISSRIIRNDRSPLNEQQRDHSKSPSSHRSSAKRRNRSRSRDSHHHKKNLHSSRRSYSRMLKEESIDDERRQRRSVSISAEEDEGGGCLKQRLMNRLKKSQSKASKITINIPMATTSKADYRIRNAPDPSSLNNRNISAVEPDAEEFRRRSRRWDLATDEGSKEQFETMKAKIIPPPMLVLPPVRVAPRQPSQPLVSLCESPPILSTNATNPMSAMTPHIIPQFTQQAPLPPQLSSTIGVPFCGMPSELAQSLLQNLQQQIFPRMATLSGISGVTGITQSLPQFTMPPPQLPPRLPPPASTAIIQPPLSTTLNQLTQLSQPHTPMFDQAELVIRAKMELYSRDLKVLKDVTELIEYMWKQGYDKIPEDDPPLLFNEIVKRKKGILGANTLYQIICYEHPELETYYCGMCNHWTTVSEMFLHLRAPMHRLNYMFRNYKMYHKKAMDEPDEMVRDVLLQKFAEQIWALEGSGQCINRMRVILNEGAIRRLWPEYINSIDNSWKIPDLDEEECIRINGTTVVEHRLSPCLSPHVRGGQNSDEIAAAGSNSHNGSSGSRKRQNLSPSANKYDRSNSARGPISSHRSRSPTSSSVSSKNKHNGRKKISDNRERPIEEFKSAAEFLAKIGDRKAALQMHILAATSEADFMSSESATKQKGREETLASQLGSGYEAGNSFLRSSADKMTSSRHERISLDERVRVQQEAIAADKGNKAQLNSAEKESMLKAMRKQTMDTYTSVKKNHMGNQAAAPRDENAERRKAIGVMVELMSLYEQVGFLGADTFFQVCEEMGIPAEDAVANPMLRQASKAMFNFDIDLEYSNRLAAQSDERYRQQQMQQQAQSQQQLSQQHHQSSASLDQVLSSIPSSSSTPFSLQSLGLSSQAVMELWRKINTTTSDGQANTSAMAAMEESSFMRTHSEDVQQSVVKGDTNNIAVDEEEMSYVYPSYADDDNMDIERDPSTVESEINRLTYAFAPLTKKQQVCGKTANRLNQDPQLQQQPAPLPQPTQQQLSLQQPQAYMTPYYPSQLASLNMAEEETAYQDPYNSASNWASSIGYQQSISIQQREQRSMEHLQREQQQLQNIAASIDDDWNSLDQHMNELLNPKRK